MFEIVFLFSDFFRLFSDVFRFGAGLRPGASRDFVSLDFRLSLHEGLLELRGVIV